MTLNSTETYLAISGHDLAAAGGFSGWARRYGAQLEQRSAAVARVLGTRMGAIAAAWTLVFVLGSIMRIMFAPVPIHGAADVAAIALPYAAVALAPIAGLFIAERAFPVGTILSQPALRLALYGKWRPISITEAYAHPAFGPAGFMASMLIGLLLNVVVRSMEFLVSIPALNAHAPAWGQALFLAMAADVGVMSFVYMVCFVLALRSVPHFPRMLLFAWGLDVIMQFAIARTVTAAAHLPASVAQPLHNLLEGNIYKVMISVAVWLPYLILSSRVNVTYRRRLRA